VYLGIDTTNPDETPVYQLTDLTEGAAPSPVVLNTDSLDYLPSIKLFVKEKENSATFAIPYTEPGKNAEFDFDLTITAKVNLDYQVGPVRTRG